MGWLCILVYTVCKRWKFIIPLEDDGEIDGNQVEQRNDRDPNQYASEGTDWEDAVVECQSNGC